MSLEVSREARRTSPQLFGRDGDIEGIANFLAEGQDVAIVAPPGMGKTSVAFEVIRRLAQAHCHTVWVPAAMTASAADLAEVIVSQIEHASRRSAVDGLVTISEEIAAGPRDAEGRLGLALEGIVRSADLLGARLVLVVDDLDALFEGGRSPGVGELFARKLRSVRQRSPRLSTLFLMRSDATLRDVFDDPAAPLFASVKTRRLEPLSALAGGAMVEDRVRQAGGYLTEDARSCFTSICRGVPAYLALAADAAAASADAKNPAVDARDAEGALAEAFKEAAPATEERIESIRRSHRLGLEVARRLATGVSPYAGEKSPNNVTRALKNLEKLGLVNRPAAREWVLTDPFLEQVLRGFDPKEIAARASTELEWLPSSLPSSGRSVSRLRGSEILGISRHWFEPAMVIQDAVHGEIRLTRLERAIVDTREFQRLRRLRQLGAVHLIYPGATHSLMEHSFGVLAASASLLESMIERGAALVLPGLGSSADRDDWAEALALARLGALVHELAAVPFGAVIESELGSLLEDYPTRQKRRWRTLVGELAEEIGITTFESQALTAGRFFEGLRPAWIGGVAREESEYGFISDLLHGPLSANSFDGAARARQALGLPSASTGRLISAMQLVDIEARRRDRRRLAVGGADRRDVQAALLDHFLALTRHQEAVVGHRATRAADAMLAAAVHHWIEALRLTEGGPGRAAHFAEDRLLGCSDDGLIDYLIEFSASAGPRGSGDDEGSEAASALHPLVDGLARRGLYRLAATTGGHRYFAEQLFDEFGSAAERRSLEQDAALAAGVREPGRILLTIPEPPAPAFGEVLLGQGKDVETIRDHRGALASEVEKLDELRERLWSIDVFLHPDILPGQGSQVVDWLGSRLRLRWEWTRTDED